MRILASAVDKITFSLAVSGILSALALAILIALTLHRGAHPIPWYDLTYFISLILVGIHELTRFLFSASRRS